MAGIKIRPMELPAIERQLKNMGFANTIELVSI
jgi:hypothetical protein